MPVSDREQQEMEEWLRFLCRHLVALCINYRETGEKQNDIRFWACPGVIICVHGIVCFLTAGHALQELEELTSRGKIEIQTAVLADTFGPKALSDHPVPFDFASAPKSYIDEDGLDFGLIALEPYYVRLLSKNGIKALFEENWAKQYNVQFDAYLILGLPEEFTKTIKQVTSTEVQHYGQVAPTLLGVKSISKPDDIPETKYPRFIGQLHPNLPLVSIVGMSGGPIFGFNLERNAYWIVAIQSAWLASRRIIFGCSIPVLAEFFRNWLDSLSETDFKSIDESDG